MSEGHHHSLVAHQFDDAVQQKEASTIGMWVFLITEIMFFGGLILAYMIYRNEYPTAYDFASRQLDEVVGLINTCVLLVSSLTMALAVYSAQLGKRKALITYIIITMVLGTVFLVVKGFEYKSKVEHHLVPGPSFHLDPEHLVVPPHINVAEVDPGNVELFFSLYFSMTGLHAFHMIIGLGIMTWLLMKAIKGRFSPEYYNPVEVSGLYWHFIDIVWIFLYPLLYLIDRTTG